MADQRITQLTKLAQADVAANDVLPIVDVGSSVTKKVEAKDFFQAGANLADNSSIDLSKLNQNSATKLDTDALADGAVTGAKLADDSSIVYDSVAPTLDNFEGRGYINSTSQYLQVWDGTAFQQVVAPTAGIEDLAVTTGKLADGAVTTAKVTALGTAAYADSSVTTAKINDAAITGVKISSGAISTEKISASGLAAAAIASDAITTEKVLDGAITAAKLAADSTTIVQAGTPVGNGAYEGQLWFDTNTSVQYVWNSTEWVRQAAINTINFSDTTPLTFAVSYPDQHTADVTTALDTQPANTVFVGPSTGADAAPTFRALVPEDLPDATSTTQGIIQPGTGLAVNAGVLNHANSVTPGIYTKVTVDAEGHVSTGALLEAVDIPSIDAAKITSGELPTDRLADSAVTIDKLADYSTSSLGETFPVATFIGQLHLNPLDRAFFMWDGNVWVPIGISAGQIVLAGTFDASTPSGIGEIESVTPDGAAAGFTAGTALPVSSATNNKFYFVVSQGGTITSGNAPNQTLAPPDIILSIYSDTNPQWVEVDVSSGAGAITASQVSFTPAASLGSTNVQTALEEVSTECRDADNITSGTLAVARGGTSIASYTKGDLIVASGATTLIKQGVGTNGQVLTADSAEATGMKWTTPFTGSVSSVTSSTAALTVVSGTTTPILSIRSATTSVNGIVQLSDSTGTTSSTVAATSTAVKAAYDLANAALPKAGGVITGALEIGSTGSLVFEGSSADGNETTLTVSDPTADRTITLPNVTGTVITTGDSGTVTSTMIADGTIVNVDINASAAIAGTKVSPDFGSQNVVTTGTATAASLNPTGSSVPTNGVYLPAANSVAISTNGVERVKLGTSEVVFNDGGNDIDFRIEGDTSSSLFFVDASAEAVGIGTTSPAFGAITGKSLEIEDTSAIPGIRIDGGASGGSLEIYATGENGVIDNRDNGGGLVFRQVGAETARIDSSGRLLIGTSTTEGNNASLQVRNDATASTHIQVLRSSNTAGAAAVIALARSRGTAASPTEVTTNDLLGSLAFAGYDGAAWVNGATIQAFADNTWTDGGDTTDNPGRLVFSTTADGASSPTERMVLNSTGALLVQGVYDSTTATAANVNVTTNGSMRRSTSSIKYKTDVETIQDQYADALLECRPVWYRSTCEGDRPEHSWWGFIAEEVAEIDPRLVQWKTTEAVVQENGSLEHVPCDPEPEGVSYDRFVPHLLNLIKRQKEQIEAMEARLSSLESQ